jgi:hypothetical protein
VIAQLSFCFLLFFSFHGPWEISLVFFPQQLVLEILIRVQTIAIEEEKVRVEKFMGIDFGY